MLLDIIQRNGGKMDKLHDFCRDFKKLSLQSGTYTRKLFLSIVVYFYNECKIGISIFNIALN